MNNYLHIIVSMEPYYFNCKDCGAPLFVEGDVAATDTLRKSGICDTCLEKKLKNILVNPLTIRAPWAKARSN